MRITRYPNLTEPQFFGCVAAFVDSLSGELNAASMALRRLEGQAKGRAFAYEMTLDQHRYGALIVLERDIGLRTFIESGVVLEARLSRDLLLSIFHPGPPLHDGAVIVQKDRIAAAACFLPLTTNPALSRKLGTRHRAAIGITEETDCLSVVVSEETGHISVAAFGELDGELLGVEMVVDVGGGQVEALEGVEVHIQAPVGIKGGMDGIAAAKV